MGIGSCKDMIGVPDNLQDVASFSKVRSDSLGVPDHTHYKYTGIENLDIDSMTYDGEDVLDISVYFGVNQEETNERRRKEGWSMVEDDDWVGSSEEGPILIDIVLYLIVEGRSGETLETNHYIPEVTEHISTETYEKLLQEEVERLAKTSRQIEF